MTAAAQMPARGPVSSAIDALNSLGAWLDAHPGTVGLLLLVVALVVVKMRAHREHIATTGELVPAPYKAWTAMVGFTLKEDARPLLADPKYAWVTPRVAAGAGIGAGVLGALLAQVTGTWMFDLLGALALLVTWMAFWRRFAPVQRDRERAVGQMFDIANSKLRLVKGAELNKHGYVNISRFKDLVVPEQVVIMYPATVDAGNPAVQTAFEQHFNMSSAVGTAWEYAWEPHNNRVIITAQPPLPSKVPFPFPSVAEFPWNEFPLGIGVGSKPLVWDPTRVPHVLVAGVSGSGKSVTQRNILLHALQSDRWRLVLVDPKRVELTQYKSAPNVLTYAVTDETMLEALQFAMEQMDTRYQLMERMEVTSYLRLPEVPPALLVMVDEVTSLLKETGIKEVDALKKQCKAIIGRIAREGRAAGVHLVLATQRPDADVLGGDTRSTIEGRVAMGKMSETASRMVLDNQLATRTPGDPRGRGIWADGTAYYTFQSYFFDDDDIKDGVEIAGMLFNGQVSADQVKAAMKPKHATASGPQAPWMKAWAAVQQLWEQLEHRAQARPLSEDDDDDAPAARRTVEDRDVDGDDDDAPASVRVPSLRMPGRRKRTDERQVAAEFEAELGDPDVAPTPAPPSPAAPAAPVVGPRPSLPPLVPTVPAAAAAVPLGGLDDEFDIGVIDDAELDRLLASPVVDTPAPPQAVSEPAPVRDFDQELAALEDDDWL